ncbi:DUF308 domain-containing protein [Caldalkalibacillus mannanilyticus]|uniref:DUF308 domain-containing protein n=1 Tax=Caldalkalibacillus mannanilyticus TaxID=1418 RepID=UPI0004685FB9|nr:DUF308 domain-containing protein [Caldalkalibacillus mannanilyticus]
MREDRTDLPHDQVAQDNDGQMTKEGQSVDIPTIGYDERATGMSQPMGVDEELPGVDTGEFTRQNAPDELYAENNIGTGFNEKRMYDENPDEETAAEVSPMTQGSYLPRDRQQESPDTEFEGDRREQMQNIETMEEQEAGGTGLGWTALVLSIISLFFLPLLTASIGVITGFFAFRNGARTLGMWAIAIGLFSIVLGLFFTPFVR